VDVLVHTYYFPQEKVMLYYLDKGISFIHFATY
jgi:hypothetical protein